MATVIHRLAKWAKEMPDTPAQRYRVNGQWKTISARELCDSVYYLALFLESRGVTSFDTCAILSFNCPQWSQMELAAHLAGARSVGLYPNALLKDVRYVLNHSDAAILAVQNREYLKKATGAGNEVALPTRIKMVIAFDNDTTVSPQAIAFDDAIAIGRNRATLPGTKTLEQLLERVDPHAGLFMIYTSGTTGASKGALISHDNLLSAVDLVLNECVLNFDKTPENYFYTRFFSFLPLCHIAEKIHTVGAAMSSRSVVHYCTKLETLSVELIETQPVIFMCVPRLWEKIMDGVMMKLKRASTLQKTLVTWGLKVGAQCSPVSLQCRRLPQTLTSRLMWALVDRVVLRKLRKKIGLGAAQVCVSGAAAMPARVSQWYQSLNLEVLENFGSTETSGLISMAYMGTLSPGTVGRPFSGVQLKLLEDGEILVQGRNVFKGYYKDDASTAEMLEGGWLHTGDLGTWDEHGQLKILGRKKEILKTSGGKMIAPLPIEEKLKATNLFNQVCLVGDGKKYLSALVTLSDGKLAELKTRNAQAIGSLLVSDEIINNEIKNYLDSINKDLAVYEQVKRFAVLSREFSIAEGELTPTLKMRRTFVEKKYAETIEQLYS